MANPNTATADQAVEQGDALPAPLSTGVVASYESMLASVPDAGEGGYERILELIAEAQDPAELDAAWRSGDLVELAGVPLTVRGITKAPSDFVGGLPWFLILDAVNEVTGEKLNVTTGAVSVVAQLVRAHAIGAFPLRVRPVVAERPTARGYYPQHLEVLK
jgi:hypothetical protein